MALFGREYGRDYGYYGGRDRGRDRFYGVEPGGYDRDFEYGFGAAAEYDRDFGYKSRWQTDYGDPFGDRISHTPMRMIRGEFHRGYDTQYGRPERTMRYGPIGPEPYDRDYETRGRGWNRESMWTRPAGGYRDYGAGRYDRGWY